MRSLFTMSMAVAALALPSAAQACGEPSNDWYAGVSDVIIDGRARCNSDRDVCNVQVSEVVKADPRFDLKGRTLRLEFTNFDDDFEQPEGAIVMICGGRLFEPEFVRFTGRFYLEYDEELRELVVRRHRVKASDGKLWRESSCVESDGKIKCSYE